MKNARRFDDGNRVVVTGMGAVSPVGNTLGEFWDSLLSGRNGVGPIDAFDTSGYESHVGAAVKLFSPEKCIESSKVRDYGRASQYAIAAARQALEMAACPDPVEMDVIIGTTMGEAQAIEAIDRMWIDQGEDRVLTEWIGKFPANTLAMNVSRELGSRGLSVVVPTACAAGNYAIGYGCDLIRCGRSRSVLVGGSDALSQIAFTGFNRLYAMSKSICRPFDKDRQGMILGEGAGVLILEPLDRAKARNAKVYAEVLGYGLSCDASHMTIPSVDGVETAMRKGMAEAGVTVEDVDYVSAHGTGTVMNDKTEAQAIRRVFGKDADELPVSSIKSMLGHSMGAASALEAIACVMAIHHSKIPPTINFETRDEECAVYCVPNAAIEKEVNVALNDAFAFGGNNACVVFGKLAG